MKIFCIGANKTGTRTLHRTFRALGYRCKHNAWWKWTLNKDTNKLNKYDFFSDNGNMSNLIWIKQEYPNAIFILNTRNLKTWLISRYNHSNIRGGFSNSPEEIKKWIFEKNKYHKKVLDLFNNNILVIDIEKDGNLETKKKLNKKFNFNIKEIYPSGINKNKKNYINNVNDINKILSSLNITEKECEMLYIPRLL